MVVLDSFDKKGNVLFATGGDHEDPIAANDADYIEGASDILGDTSVRIVLNVGMLAVNSASYHGLRVISAHADPRMIGTVLMSYDGQNSVTVTDLESSEWDSLGGLDATQGDNSVTSLVLKLAESIGGQPILVGITGNERLRVRASSSGCNAIAGPIPFVQGVSEYKIPLSDFVDQDTGEVVDFSSLDLLVLELSGLIGDLLALDELRLE